MLGLVACLCACVLGVLGGLRAYVLAFLRAYMLMFPSCLRAYILTCLLPCMLICFHVDVRGILACLRDCGNVSSHLLTFLSNYFIYLYFNYKTRSQ